jgi:NADPH-dependent curcumin reductase CurA
MGTIRQIGMRRLQDVKVQHYLSWPRPAGLTALAGLIVIGQVQAAETAVVSAAAGATGSTVLLLAKAHTCRVIGLCTDADKAAVPDKIEALMKGPTIGKTMVLV